MTAHPELGEASAAVAGLARELEALRRRIDLLLELPGQVEQLAQLATGLANQLDAHTTRSAPAAGPSWLDFPGDVGAAKALLDELTRWLAMVYLRYPDAAHGLPDCWLWHPDLVEELLWLMHAWTAAYLDDGACVALVGDWHDRYRPGVVRRITATAGRCSLENHQDLNPADGALAVPVVEATDVIATWWGNNSRTQPAPKPTTEHLASAATRRRPGGRR